MPEASPLEPDDTLEALPVVLPLAADAVLPFDVVPLLVVAIAEPVTADDWQLTLESLVAA